MKKITLTLITAALVAASANAATGFFGNAYTVANTGTFYQTTGTDDGVNPQLTDGFGTLTQGDTFNIQGFELNTFEDNSSEITHMNLFWTVDNFTNTHQVQINPAPTKSGNNRFWQIASATQNLLNNNGVATLTAGNYTFQAYFEGYTNGLDTLGNIFLNNGGANYSASFTVAVPEPGSFALIAGALGMAWVTLRRRRS